MPILATRLHLGLPCFATALALVLLALPARAAEPVFPTGSRLGIVPPAGMVPSRNFIGFEDPQKNAAILFTTLPAKAYEALDKSMVPEAMKKDGVDVDKREPVQLGIGKGFLLSGTQANGTAHYRKWLLVAAARDMTALVTIQVPEQDATYPDQAMRDTLATLALRESVPDAEQISLVPFAIGDLAGFHVNEVLPGRAVMLVDRVAPPGSSPGTDQDRDSSSYNARMFIAAVPGAPPQLGDRSNFARTIFQQIIAIKDVQIQDAEPLRIGNQSGFETLAKAKDTQSNADVMVVQWLRFGTGGFLQMVGIVQADAWPAVFTRLRTVRDSIETK